MKLHRALLVASLLVAAPRAARAEPPLRVDLGGGVTMELVHVSPGSFTQGSPAAEKGREAEEKQRQVRLTEGYFLGKYPVTVGQFRRFAVSSSYRTEAERGASGGSGWDGKALVQKKEFNWKNPGFPQTDDHPVTLVTYDDADAFALWLTRTVGRKFSLPTEAQWENAYRAGAQGPFYQGSTDNDALALGWFKENAGKGTQPVGKKRPNALGLFDMAGNVFEWCSDYYAPYPDGAAVDPQATSPDPSDKARRVLRGGSWLKDPKHGRAAARYRNTPGSRNADNGFRVAAALQGASPGAAAAPDPSPPSSPSPPAKSPPQTPPGTMMAMGFGVFACTGSIAVALLAIVVIMVKRSSGRSRSGIRFRPGPDGFWIHAPPRHRGATLHYRYHGTTGAQEGQVALEGGEVGQFVYTGAPPRSVEEMRLIPLPRPPQAPRGQPARQQVQGRPQPYRPQQGRGQSPRRAPVVVQHHHHHHHHNDSHNHHHHHSHHDDDPSPSPEPFMGYPSAY